MNTNEHELMTEEIRRIRSERDFLAKIIGEAATEELKRNRRTHECASMYHDGIEPWQLSIHTSSRSG